MSLITLFRLCPNWVYWLVASLALYLGGEAHGRFAQKRSDDQARQVEIAAAERAAEADRQQKQSQIDSLSEKLAKKSDKSRQVVQTNLAKVDQYAPTDFPPLPGAFRVWHDAAAAGEEADDSRRADAASVSLVEVEARIAGNYAACLYDQQRLEMLQAIVKTINGGADGKETDSR